MNNKILLPILGSVAVFLGAGAMIHTTSKENKEIVKERNKEGAEEIESAAGYVKYRSHILGDATTGIVNIDDVLNTRQELALQQNAPKSRAFNTLNWIERGPDNIGGRVRAVLVDKNNTSKVYAAAAGGGLWVSNDNANTWVKQPMSDTLSSLSGSALAQSKDGDIYYGTGEGVGNGGDLFTTGSTNVPGDGIFKSTDNGVTFKKMKGPVANTTGDWAYINKIACDPNDNNKVYAATNNGLKKSVDAGVTWTNVSGISGMVYSVEAGTNNHVWVGTSSNLYVSTDAGTTFTAKFGNGGLPTGGVSRVELSHCKNSPDNVVIVTVSSSPGGLKGVYKSTDGGTNWTTLATGGSQQFEPFGSYAENPARFQGFWDVAIGMNPTNPDIIYLGGMLDLYKYTPSTNFKTVANWLGSASAGKLVHADMHGVTFDPSNPETMYVNCDGGVYRTNNSSSTNPLFSEKNKNLNVYQAYAHGASTNDKVIMGAQDNGSVIIGYETNSPLSSTKVGGGDGTSCLFSDFTTTVFTCVVNGALDRSPSGLIQGSYNSFYDANIDTKTPQAGVPTEGAPWVMPMVLREKFIAKVLVSHDSITGVDTYQDSVNSAMVICTGTGVWFNQGAINLSKVPSWFKLIPPTISGSFVSVHLTKDGNTIFAGTTSGNIYRWSNVHLLDTVYAYANGANGVWNKSAIPNPEIVGTIAGRYITSLTTDDVDGEELIVTLGQYGQTSQVYKSINAISGTAPLTFTDITNNLPKMPCYSAGIIPVVAGSGNGITNGKNNILLGTESGVWASSNGGTTWQEANLMSANSSEWHPRLSVVGLSIKTNVQGYTGPVIYTSTHGRGAFTSYSLAHQWPTATTDLQLQKENISVYPNPAINNATILYNSKTSKSAYIQVYDLLGKLVKQEAVSLIVGENKLNLDLYNLAAGGYIVNLQMPNARATSTIVKQ